MDIYRHGDVIISSIEAIPDHACKRSDLILAYGELTGHAHRVEPQGMAELYDGAGQMFLHVVGAPARVVHEEHEVIELPPGRYRVWCQREYDPLTDERWIED